MVWYTKRQSGVPKYLRITFGAGEATLVYKKHFVHQIGVSSTKAQKSYYSQTCTFQQECSVQNQRILYEMIFSVVSYSVTVVL